MTDIKSIIKSSLKDINPMNDFVKIEFEKMFVKWNESKSNDRTGLHASSIIASDSDFCFREQILSFHYKKFAVPISPKMLGVFLNGWYVHIKWQTLFEKCGVAESIEETRVSKLWNVYLTPDAVINLFGRKYIVEIKSMNTFQFKHLKGPPINAVRQCQFYMHILGIPYGIILVEDKNDQNFHSWVIEYDPIVARPFIERLYKIQKYEEKFQESGKLPIGLCEILYSGGKIGAKSPLVRRSERCDCRKACFASKLSREKLFLQ